MSGKIDSGDLNTPSPLVLVDHSMVNAVADALALVDLPVKSAYEVFERRDNVKDEEIIAWLGQLGPAGIWVHVDDRAKKMHKADIVSNRISTIWVRRKGGRMSARSQLRLIAYVIPYVLETYAPFDRPFHITEREHGNELRPRFRIEDYKL